MKRKQFTFYRSYRDGIRKLKKMDRLAIYEAIFDFALDGFVDNPLNERQEAYFQLILPGLINGRSKAMASLLGKHTGPAEDGPIPSCCSEPVQVD